MLNFPELPVTVIIILKPNALNNVLYSVPLNIYLFANLHLKVLRRTITKLKQIMLPKIKSRS
jgi:hypothetical protein